jgi:hypothetical protein
MGGTVAPAGSKGDPAVDKVLYGPLHIWSWHSWKQVMPYLSKVYCPNAVFYICPGRKKEAKAGE